MKLAGGNDLFIAYHTGLVAVSIVSLPAVPQVQVVTQLTA